MTTSATIQQDANEEELARGRVLDEEASSSGAATPERANTAPKWPWKRPRLTKVTSTSWGCVSTWVLVDTTLAALLVKLRFVHVQTRRPV